MQKKVLTACLLVISSCAVQIQDATYCALIPGNNGAVCDSFLTSHQQILTQAQWDILQGEWENGGNAVECTPSSAVANLKQELELLCSKTACDYQTVQSAINEALDKLTTTGEAAQSRFQSQ